jgi:hypothetical protein
MSQDLNPERILDELEDICVRCGADLNKNNFRVYKREIDEPEDVFHNIDLMCRECFDEVDTSKSVREFKKEVSEAVNDIQEKHGDIDEDKFCVELIKRLSDS